MLVELVLWVIFGALVGWVASLLTGMDGRMGAGSNIIVGIIGSLLGGFIARMLIGADVTGFNLPSFIISLLGAVILLMIVQAFTHSRA